MKYFGKVSNLTFYLPYQVVRQIKEEVGDTSVFAKVQPLQRLPDQEICHYNPKTKIGVVVTKGWNGSFHEAVYQPVIVVFATGRRGGRLGKVNKLFQKVLAETELGQDKTLAEIEAWENSRASEA